MIKQIKKKLLKRVNECSCSLQYVENIMNILDTNDKKKYFLQLLSSKRSVHLSLKELKEEAKIIDIMIESSFLSN